LLGRVVVYLLTLEGGWEMEILERVLLLLFMGVIGWWAGLVDARLSRAEAEYELLKRALKKAGIDPYGK